MKPSTLMSSLLAISVSVFAPLSSAQAPAPAQKAATAQAPQAAQVVKAEPLYILMTSPKEVKGWDRTTIGQDTVYINPKPLLGSADLTNIDPLANKDGQGFIGLYFNDAGKTKLADVSRANSGQRIAVVVGQDIVALPLLKDPLNDGFMMFGVVSPQAAQIIAHKVAGQPLPQ
ncbi:MAG: hypothetical protein QM803_06790 [Rhodocyclaceae bacterium]